jgi:SAM-dependent methyltransferase
MKEFWNARFKEEDFAYGTSPNLFFKENIDRLSVGKILLPAEGEGRNAVYAAHKGWDVEAFDFSESAKQKALLLAKNQEVSFEYQVIDIVDFQADNSRFDVVGLFFAHFPVHLRATFHRKVMEVLKKGGHIIFEAFHKNQLNYTSGGPKDSGMLFSTDEIEKEFSGLEILKLEDEIITLNEGPYHQGLAHVIRFVATKK